MSIYANSFSSEKVMPYVYMCIHKITGCFYIGSRTNKKQNLPSHLDLPNYKTSSKIVKPNFGDYDWCIVAEFFDPVSAYEFEQSLIYENWDSSLLINDSCHHKTTAMFSNTGKTWSKERREKQAKTPHSYQHTQEAKNRISAARTGKSRVPFSPETRHKMSLAQTGKTLSPEARAKVSAARKEYWAQRKAAKLT